MSRQPRDLADVLGQVLGRVASESRRSAALQPVWEQVVGVALATRNRCTGVEGKALCIEVEAASWADALQRDEARILSELRTRTGLPLERLHFRLARTPGT